MLREADKDNNGSIDKEEFKQVMDQRKNKMGGMNMMMEMREQLRRYIQREEMKKKFKKIGSHIPALLDQFAQAKEDAIRSAQNAFSGDLKEAKIIYTEHLDKESYTALYNECWDLLNKIFKIKEEEDKRKTTLKKQ